MFLCVSYRCASSLPELSPVQSKPRRAGAGQPEPGAHLPDLVLTDQSAGGRQRRDATRPVRVHGWEDTPPAAGYETETSQLVARSFEDHFLGGTVCMPPRKQQWKGLTFTVRSAIQPKYQFPSIKAAALVQAESSHADRLINVHSDSERKALSCAPLGFHPQRQQKVIDPRSLSFSSSFRAFKGAFHGGATERSTQVHARQLPPPLPCQQARYCSVIDVLEMCVQYMSYCSIISEL